MADSPLIQRLRGAGLRATAPRRAVIRVLEDSREHLSAEDIHRALVRGGVRVNLSSVYRTLTLLLRLGLVRAAAPAERHGHFEVDHEERVHLICARCGAVTEARLPRNARIEQALSGLARRAGFALTQFSIEASGECANCQRGKPNQRRLRASAPCSRGRAGVRRAQR